MKDILQVKRLLEKLRGTQQGHQEFQEKAQKDYAMSSEFLASGGWLWMQAQLVEMSNSVAEQFMTGGRNLQEYEALSARLRLLGEILELPGKKQVEYSLQLKDIREQDSYMEKGGIDPVDRDPMSPVPDYPDDYR